MFGLLNRLKGMTSRSESQTKSVRFGYVQSVLFLVAFALLLT